MAVHQKVIKKLNIEFPYDPAISFILKLTEHIFTQKLIHDVNNSTIALFIIAQKYKQPNVH